MRVRLWVVLPVVVASGGVAYAIAAQSPAPVSTGSEAAAGSTVLRRVAIGGISLARCRGKR